MKYFILILLSLFSILYAPPVFAQTNPLPPTVSPTSPIYTDLIVNNMFHTFSCLMIGSSVISQPCLTYQSGIPVLSQVNLSGGALGATTSLIGMLYANPPVRTVDYLGSLGEQIGIVKPAHAQVFGSGAEVLKPILSLWTVSRNIAYVAMIIVFLIIGLMVLFRNRINPQTVITAQAALPGLVIGLILITFSYFLAALVTDTAFIGTNLIGYYFQSAQPPSNTPGATPTPTPAPANLVDRTTKENALTIMGKLMNGIGKNPITDGIGAFFNSLVDPAAQFVRAGVALAAYQFGSGFGGGLGAIAGMAICGIAALPFITIPGINLAALGGAGACSVVAATIGGATGGPAVGIILATKAAQDPPAMVGLALWLIAGVIIIYSMFRLLLRLINNFLSIIFLVITAPFQFLAAALPGRQGLATNWILNMLGNVLAFPAVMGVFYFVNYLLGSNNIPNSPFTVGTGGTITGSNTLPLFGGLGIDTIRILLAFGALVATPAIPDIISRTIGKVGVAGQLIGQEVGTGVAGGQRYLGQAQGTFGTAERDIGGLGQLGPGYNYQVLPGGQVAVMQQPGLMGRLSGTPPRLVRIIPPPPCLPPNILISTPCGPKAIKNIGKDDVVWTIDSTGKKRKTRVKRVAKRRVFENHKILWLVLADGRQLYVSLGHPDATGKDLALLRRGNYFDHSHVVKTELLSYDGQYTYDILPEGRTGAYWANNILIGSTLKVRDKNFMYCYSQNLAAQTT